MSRRGKRAAGVLALNRASHRVAFALLTNPPLAGSPVRAVATAARASVGTVHSAFAQLTEAGFLLDGRLHDAGRLLNAWVEAYQRIPVRLLEPRPLYASKEDWRDRPQLDPGSGVLLGGLAAAAVLDDRFRATDGIAYVDHLRSAVTLLRLTPTPSPFRVEVRERFWGDGLPSAQPGLVPSVLIYGDLLRDGDARSLSIAADLRNNDAHLRTLD